MAQLTANDRSPAAREIFAEATRAGITRESIGSWMNLAARARYAKHGARPADEARCLRRALEIHETWGQRHATYAFSTEGTTLRDALARLAELTAAGF